MTYMTSASRGLRNNCNVKAVKGVFVFASDGHGWTLGVICFPPTLSASKFSFRSYLNQLTESYLLSLVMRRREEYIHIGSVYKASVSTNWVTAAGTIFVSLRLICSSCVEAQLGGAAANQGAACTERFPSPNKFRKSMLVWSLQKSISYIQRANYIPPISDNHYYWFTTRVRDNFCSFGLTQADSWSSLIDP